MKRIVLVIAVASLCMVGATTLAAENSQATSGKDEKPYNAVTYFDLGPAYNCAEPAEAGEQEKPYNGITSFDLRQPGSGARGSCANKKSAEPERVWYNGVTAF